MAVSAISAANALQNLDAEIPDWRFERVRDETRAKWDRELAKIQIEGSQEDKETFYTGMYHAFLAPNLYQDVTGEYRGLDSNIHRAKGANNYAVFSLWDTYRATHPLFALVQAERDGDMIQSLLAHYDQSADHLLPMWSLQGNETWCMIGYHAVPVIVDGFLKGVKVHRVAPVGTLPQRVVLPHEPAVARLYLNKFETLWNACEIEPELRRLQI